MATAKRSSTSAKGKGRAEKKSGGKKVARTPRTPAAPIAARSRKKNSDSGGAKTSTRAQKAVQRRRKPNADVTAADPSLFAPLSEGERCDALRLVTETPQLAAMAKVGRYRVVAAEPLVLKPPEPRASHRLARIVIYDYSSDRQVDACVDLDNSEVFHATSTRAQPMLSIDEEGEALTIAVNDPQVQEALTLGDEATAILHYWSRDAADIAYQRRSAAVLFGPLGARPTLAAVVDLVDRSVVEVVPAARW